MKKLILLLTLILSVSLIGCIPSEPINVEGKINICTVIFPEFDFTRTVAGDYANISMLISPGASTHSFEPSPADIINIQEADVFIYTGGQSQEWAEKILGSINNSDEKTVIRLMDYVSTVSEDNFDDEGNDHDHDDHDDHDEHIWTSPTNAIKLVNAISTELQRIDEDNSNTYEANAKKYIDELRDIDSEIKAVVNAATHNKIIVADRFPFRYLTDAYSLKYEAAFSGCSDQSDASPRTITRLINSVKVENISHIFYVENSSQNVARTISEQTGAEMLLLHSAHTVTKAEFDGGLTYVDIMRKNIESLRTGLQ